MQPEARIVKRIQAYVAKEGGFLVKIHGGENPFQQPGISDLLGVYKGVPLALEVKQPGAKPTRIQAAFLRKWSAAGGVSAVVTSVYEVQGILDAINRGGK